MPFKSRAQMRQCYALSKAGNTWDCKEWYEETIKNGKLCLPEYVGGKVKCTKAHASRSRLSKRKSRRVAPKKSRKRSPSRRRRVSRRKTAKRRSRRSRKY